MKIIGLAAENVKRLKAVTINPDGTLQVLTGRNGQGKSSVLDAIWLALGGRAASSKIPRPIRDGEDSAEVRLDLGDLIVTRAWGEKGTTLTVCAADGAKYRRPQELLDGLVGQMSFDPLGFTRLTAREQREQLLDVLGLDFTTQDQERARLYDLRLDTGRRAHAFGDLPKLPKGAPMVEQSATAVIERIEEARRQQRTIEDADRELHARALNVGELEARIQQMQRDLSAAKSDLDLAREMRSTLPTPEPIEPLTRQLASLDDYNAEARENQRIATAREQQATLQSQYTDITHQIDAIDQAKADAIAAARMPVDGLGFTDDGVTYQGVPFSQASSAEQIRVSLGMAMALNPTLRVIHIRDGSLLDADSMQAVADLASTHDYQVWVETVGDEGVDGAVVIEDGQVAS